MTGTIYCFTIDDILLLKGDKLVMVHQCDGHAIEVRSDAAHTELVYNRDTQTWACKTTCRPPEAVDYLIESRS